MKKLMIGLMCLVLLTVAALPVAAQTRHGRRHHAHTTRYARTSSSNQYGNSRRAYYSYSQPRGRTFWQKHRDKLTTAAGAGGGALIGGIAGGHKGAAIGALAGGGGSALYTYKLRKRNRRY